MNAKWSNIVAAALMAVTASAALGARSAQGPELRGVMQQKLSHAHKILDAVVTSDWAALDENVKAMEQLTKDPRWMALRYPEYAQQSSAFVRAVQDLKIAASRRDLARTPDAFAALTLKCVECHRYLARARMAQ
jgi:hypothetical protein